MLYEVITKNAGRFVLRIEDTDEARSTEASVNAILESMEWLGIDWDDGPYFQTQRHDIYNEHIDRLVEQGHAYYCDCTPEEVNAMREEARAKGLNRITSYNVCYTKLLRQL